MAYNALFIDARDFGSSRPVTPSLTVGEFVFDPMAGAGTKVATRP